MKSLAKLHDVALLDLDGVVYVGGGAVDHAADSLKEARADGMRLAFVTNNASRPPDVVAAHLTELGVSAAADEVVTSAQATARVLAERVPESSKVLVVGGLGLEGALRERGLVPVSSLADDPVAVVQGFAPDVDWAMLAEATYAVAAGLLWVASNTDLTIPTARGPAPGNGALVGVVRAATGVEPLVAGKPEPAMHREAVLRTGALRPLVVGDRLDTDIEGANRAEVASLLVLTGVTDPVDLVLAPAQQRPTHVGHDLRALLLPGEAAGVRAGVAGHGRWSVAVVDGNVRVAQVRGDDGPKQQPDDRLDLLRSVCGAVWADGTDVATSSIRRALRVGGW